MDENQWIAIEVVLRLATAVFFGFALLMGKAWNRYRRPGWADTPANIVIPAGRWIMVSILVVVFVFLAYAITKDPLAPH